MTLWRLCILVMLFSGLCIGILLAGCGGDNPCEQASPDTCALIPNTALNTCVVIREDDFACKCCAADEEECPPPDENLCFQWSEADHTCQPRECD